MREMTMKKAISNTGRVLAPIALWMWLAATAFAAAPGITGPTFYLTAQQAYSLARHKAPTKRPEIQDYAPRGTSRKYRSFQTVMPSARRQNLPSLQRPSAFYNRSSKSERSMILWSAKRTASLTM